MTAGLEIHGTVQTSLRFDVVHFIKLIAIMTHGAIKMSLRFKVAYFFIKFDRHYELRGPYWSSSTTTLSLRLGNGFIDVSQPYQRLPHHNYHLIFATGGFLHEINDKRESESKFTLVTLIFTVRVF